MVSFIRKQNSCNISSEGHWPEVSAFVVAGDGLKMIFFSNFKVLKDLSRHFKVGSGYQCTVLKVNQEQKSLDLSMAGRVILLQCQTKFVLSTIGVTNYVQQVFNSYPSSILEITHPKTLNSNADLFIGLLKELSLTIHDLF